MSITTVTAAADVRLSTIAALARDLCDAFAGDGAVRLDLSQAVAPDLSVLQLVQSARATAAATQRDFALSAPADATLTALIARAGFPDRSDDDRQFWFHGVHAQ